MSTCPSAAGSEKVCWLACESKEDERLVKQNWLRILISSIKLNLNVLTPTNLQVHEMSTAEISTMVISDMKT